MHKENNQPQINHYHFNGTHVSVNFVDQGIGTSQCNSAKQYFNENAEVAQLKNRIASLEREAVYLRTIIVDSYIHQSEKKNPKKLANVNTSRMPSEISRNLFPL